MINKKIGTSLPILAWNFLLIAFLATFIVCQTPQETLPRITDFGKSLKLGYIKESESNVKANRKNDSEDVIKIETAMVLNDILVIDKTGKTINGLNAEDFEIEEDNTAQKIESFSRGTNQNISRSIVLIFDTRTDLLGYFKTSLNAAKTLVDNLFPNDKLAIVTDRLELIADFTNDKDLLKSRLDSIDDNRFDKWKVGNGEFSALYASLNELFDYTSSRQRPIIIFQTKGNQLTNLKDSALFPQMIDLLMRIQERHFTKQEFDIVSKKNDFTLDDVLTATEKTRATIYSIIPGYQMFGLTDAEQIDRVRSEQDRFNKAYFEYSKKNNIDLTGYHPRGLVTEPQQILRENRSFLGMAKLELNIQRTLGELSKFTGGWTEFLETPEQAHEIYSRILANINNRYLIGYYPTNQEHDGKVRNINITIKGHPAYIVWGRKTYIPLQD